MKEHGTKIASGWKARFGGIFWIFVILAPGACAAPRITLGTLVPEGTSYHRSLLEMGAKWRKAPAGGARLQIYANGKMGGEAKMVNQMRLGALDAGLLSAVGLSAIEPAVAGLQSLPMMFRSLEEFDYIAAKLQPMLARRLEQRGFIVLFWTDAGWIRFFSKRPVLLPDDLKKLKLFTWAGDPTVLEVWKKAGFHPVPLETATIGLMLETDMIQAVPMPPFVALATQVYKPAPHMLELNWAPLIGALVMSKQSWQKLPENTRAEMMKSAQEAGTENRMHGRAESVKAVEAMKSKGLNVHPATPEIDATWRRTAEDFYPQIKDKIVPADILEEVTQLLKEFRTQQTNAPSRTARQ
jgi:TRAP-type C4-dicarboxylate transport system substrate-binding protein